jgi:hypothetical protein
MTLLPTHPKGGHVSKGDDLLLSSVHTPGSPVQGREGRIHLEDGVKPYLGSPELGAPAGDLATDGNNKEDPLRRSTVNEP